MSVELVYTYRGNKIENIHRGDITAVKENGDVIFKYGNRDKKTFWRSSAKPFQIIPFIKSDGISKFNIEKKELAIMVSSHNGEPEHVKTISNLLKKFGKNISNLDCGISRPMYEKEYRRLLKENIPFSQANNPCSGKHSAMLALCTLKNIPIDNYILSDHIIQKMILKTISEVTELAETSIDIAIDGCGVPVFALPLYNMALAYSKLAHNFEKEEKKENPLYLIRNAMTANPFYVAGSKRLDTIIMEETNGKVLAKLGAEAVYCISIVDKGIGIAVKIEDGNNKILNSVIPNLLLKHNYINKDEFNSINSRLHLKILNHRKEIVGEYKCII